MQPQRGGSLFCTAHPWCADNLPEHEQNIQGKLLQHWSLCLFYTWEGRTACLSSRSFSVCFTDSLKTGKAAAEITDWLLPLHTIPPEPLSVVLPPKAGGSMGEPRLHLKWSFPVLQSHKGTSTSLIASLTHLLLHCTNLRHIYFLFLGFYTFRNHLNS